MIKKLLILPFILAISGCASSHLTYDKVDMRRGFAPQTNALVSATNNVDAASNSPVLIRIFKESYELELWHQTNNGKYALVNTFKICTFSGKLGPKQKQGDRQAPEGFYSINSSQLNYNSIRFVSLNTGYPNKRDKYHNATGSAVMIHGGCDSAGCYAIQDAPMQDLFAAVRDALKAGQKSVQLQIYPFRMNDLNMFQFSNSPHIKFWRELKLGYDKFEATHKEINVSVVNGKYVIN
jgi:murein L,D-transpeptidase YafK